MRRKEDLNAQAHAKKKSRVGKTTGVKMKASKANDVWSWDFIHDVTEDGRSIRILSIIDEYSRYCLCLRAQRSFRSSDELSELGKAIRKYGAPKNIRSDNGSEFIAKNIQSWLSDKDIDTLYIEPGSPWQNPYVESFHGRFRNDCLNREWFINLLDARCCIEDFQNTYNTIRPHSGIKYKTPQEIYLKQDFDFSRPTVSFHQRLANPTKPIQLLTEMDLD